MVAKLEMARAAGIARNEIIEVRRMVDKLVHSQQQGSRFGELFAIGLLGILIVMGLLFFSEGSGAYGDITSFLMSSVVVFLIFIIWDLQKDRKNGALILKGGRYIVNFQGVERRDNQQFISVVTSIAVASGFVLLFLIRG